MGVATSLLALADIIDPTQAYWSVLMRSGRVWSEHSLVGTWRAGQKGVRLLDWGDDIVSTGDVHRVKEIRLHLPSNRGPDLPPLAVLEMTKGMEPFQFKRRSVQMLGAWRAQMEFVVIGRVTDANSGACECFIWDYNPTPERPYLPEIIYQAPTPRIGEPGEPGFIEGTGEILGRPEQTYRAPGPHFLAYRSTIHAFGSWRDNMTPISELALDVQGFRL